MVVSLPKTTRKVTEHWRTVGAGCHRKLNTPEVSLLTEMSEKHQVTGHGLKANCKDFLSSKQNFKNCMVLNTVK
jgi:hypothetical protein